MTFEEATRRAKRDSGSLVWHYTTLDTLALILKSGHLLATEVSFLNDIRETRTADEVFGEALDGLDNGDNAEFIHGVATMLQDIDSGQADDGGADAELLASARFVLCASLEGDSLYAWRTYSNAGGCAIGLDPRSPLSVVTSEGEPAPAVNPWSPVIYERAELLAEAYDELKLLAADWHFEQSKADDDGFVSGGFDLFTHRAPRVRSALRARAKDPAFREENEVRMTVEPWKTSSIITTSSSMGPRPHLRLAAANTWHKGVAESAEPALLPIRAIRLGPGAPEAADKGLRWLLRAHGYPLDPDPITQFDGDPQGDGRLDPDWSKTVIIDRSRRPYRTT